MPMLSFKAGVLIAIGIGVFLSMLSTLIINYHVGLFSGLFPPSGTVGGVPVGFWEVEINASHSITRIGAFYPIHFVLNTLFWTAPFLLAFVMVQYGLREWLLQAAWHRWLFVVVVFGPALLELASFCNFILAFSNLPSFPAVAPLSTSVAFWLSVPSYQMALWLIKIAYCLFTGFNLSLLLLSLFRRQGTIPLRYSLVAAVLLFSVFLADFPLLLGYLGQRWKRPFTVDHMVISPRKEDGGQILEYRLTSFRLPKENTIYTIDCEVLDWRLNPNREYRISRGDYYYVKQEQGKLYLKVPGTYLKDNQFIEQPALSGTIEIFPNTRPKYLFVSVEYKRVDRSMKYGTDEGYAKWYIVPLTKDMFVKTPAPPDSKKP